jgi:precorrin-2 dehydrogenase/sirohydrochlorin ferrochelatase
MLLAMTGNITWHSRIVLQITREMPYYPIFVDLQDQGVLVVGGGEVAERKIRDLITYDCRISIASLKLTPYLKELIDCSEIRLLDLDSLDESLHGFFMVIAATDDPAFNSRIASKAKAHGILVNCVDQPLDCTFIMPSVVKSGGLQIAISTGGKSPALAKKIREELEGIFGPEYACFIELLGLVRRELLSKGKPSSDNKIIFQRLVNSPLLELIKEGDIRGVRCTLSSFLEEVFPVDAIVNQVFSGT